MIFIFHIFVHQINEDDKRVIFLWFGLLSFRLQTSESEEFLPPSSLSSFASITTTTSSPHPHPTSFTLAFADDL